MLAAIVEGLSELIRLKVTPPETERMIATAIVSPSARPSPSIEPLISADLPNGRTVIRIISQRVAPSAVAPSWSFFGRLREDLAGDGRDDRQDHQREDDRRP